MLELTIVTFRRALWRRRLRALWTAGGGQAICDSDWAERLRVSSRELRRACELRCFGETWAEIEAISPRLKRQLVTGRGLRRELRRMRRMVEAVRGGVLDLDGPQAAKSPAVQAA